MEISYELLNDIITTLYHARTFITSRQKMHKTGVELYDKLYSTLKSIASQHITPADPQMTHGSVSGKITDNLLNHFVKKMKGR